MNALFTALWLGECAGLLIGLLLNLVLVLAIRRSSAWRKHSYSHLFMVGALFDVVFAVVELATQHQLLIKRGTLFVMPHGFEKYLPPWTYPIFMAPHGFVILHGLYILAAQYHYRYVVVSCGRAPVGVLLRNVAITSAMAAVGGVGLGAGSLQGLHKRGYHYYLNFVDHEWFESDGSTHFRYACDTRDLGPQVFFYGGCLGATLCSVVVAYYGVKAFRFVNGQSKEGSRKTRDLQMQFARTLIAQTVSAFFFAFVPVMILVFCAAFQIDGKMTGTGVMSPVSWLPAANASITIYVVRDYRHYVLRRLGFGGHQVSSSTTTPASAGLPSLGFSNEPSRLVA